METLVMFLINSDKTVVGYILHFALNIKKPCIFTPCEFYGPKEQTTTIYY